MISVLFDMEMITYFSYDRTCKWYISHISCVHSCNPA